MPTAQQQQLRARVSSPGAALAVDESNDEVHKCRGDEHFDQIVVKLLQDQLPERRACVGGALLLRRTA